MRWQRTLCESAGRQQLATLAGIDAPNEPPENAEIVVPPDQQSLDEAVAAILGQLLPRLRPEERAT